MILEIKFSRVNKMHQFFLGREAGAVREKD